jgi:ATP-binding cassette subfamily B protein
MAEENKNVKPPAKRGGHGPGAGAAPVEKAKNFKASIARLVGMIYGKSKGLTVLMIVMLIISAGASAMGPKVLGNATNILFDGLISKEVTHTLDCALPPAMSIDIVKDAISDEEGHLDFDKLEQMQQGMTSQAATAPADPSITQVVTPKEGCDASGQATAEAGDEGETDEFSGQANMDGLKDMLSQMTITVGGGVEWNSFRDAILLSLLVYILTTLFRWFGGWVGVQLIGNGTRKLRADIEHKIWRVPLSRFDKMSRGEFMSRMTNDLDNVQQCLQQTGGDLVYLVLMVATVIGMMFSVSWILALIALVTVPISMGIISLIMKVSGPAFKKQWATTGDLNATVEESISGHAIVKAYGKDDEFAARFDGQNEALFKAGFKAQFVSTCMAPIMTFITNLNYVLVALIGGLQVLAGNMTLGDVQAFIQYSRQYSQPLTQIAQMVNMLQSGAASAERIFEVLDFEEESDEIALVAIDKDYEISEGQIEFKNVDFSYDPDQELIKNMNLVAAPGETVAIVGQTGAGKTTLVNLIMRFYETQGGEISVDGKNIKEISRYAFRRNVGMVLQDSWLFRGTIKENLLYGVKPGLTITDQQFEEACKATYVDNFVKALPKGYDTVLDEDASSLSAGEKQLLTIARAFLSDPNILILDEATSSVDTRTEVLVQKAMNRLRANRTSFVIAHRLSTIRDADQIVVMDKGSIVEQGNHNTLISAGGYYAKLYQSQFDDADENMDEVA